MSEKQNFTPGTKILIKTNPHEAAEGIIGTVKAYRAGEGFMRCDLVEVEYHSPREGALVVYPFGTFHLGGTAEEMEAAADVLEAQAADLRRLAKEARS